VSRFSEEITAGKTSLLLSTVAFQGIRPFLPQLNPARFRLDFQLLCVNGRFQSGHVEKAAEVFDMGVKQTAFGLFPEQKNGNLTPGGVYGSLEPRRTCTENNHIVKRIFLHISSISSEN
jgi:hypothetical protein